MHDIIVIGAGTAGLSAAIYGCRAGRSVLILEKAIYGGQIINAREVENYPGIKNISGYEFATNLYEQALSLGAELMTENVVSIKNEEGFKIVNTNKGSHKCKSIVIATGSKNRTLGLENEDRYVGRGVSYCATCDGAFFRNMDVAVAGGGNTALSDAIYLSGICKKVYLIHRRKSFRGEKSLVKRVLEAGNIVTCMESVVSSINGSDTVESVDVKNVNDNSIKTLEVQGLFVAVGHTPQNEGFGDVVKLDGQGYIIAGEDCTTDIEGIFVAGDCRTKEVRQLTTAAADGAIAAIKASEIE